MGDAGIIAGFENMELKMNNSYVLKQVVSFAAGLALAGMGAVVLKFGPAAVGAIASGVERAVEETSNLLKGCFTKKVEDESEVVYVTSLGNAFSATPSEFAEIM